MKITWTCLLLVGCLCLSAEGFWFQRGRRPPPRRVRVQDEDDDTGADANRAVWDRKMMKTAKSVMGKVAGLARDIDASLQSGDDMRANDDDNGDEENGGGVWDRKMMKTAKSVMGKVVGLARDIDESLQSSDNMGADDDVDDDDNGDEENSGGIWDSKMQKTAKSLMGKVVGLARDIDASLGSDGDDGNFVHGMLNEVKKVVTDDVVKDVGNVVNSFMGMVGENGGRRNGGNQRGGFFFR